MIFQYTFAAAKFSLLMNFFRLSGHHDSWFYILDVHGKK